VLQCRAFGQVSSIRSEPGRAIWEIVQQAYVILTTLDNTTQGELTRYENNYKTLNLIIIALGRNVYDRVSPRNCS
jgi:hypothetical protein